MIQLIIADIKTQGIKNEAQYQDSRGWRLTKQTLPDPLPPQIIQNHGTRLQQERNWRVDLTWLLDGGANEPNLRHQVNLAFDDSILDKKSGCHHEANFRREKRGVELRDC